MNRGKLFNRFQFKYYPPFHEDVYPSSTDINSLILHTHRHLTFERQTLSCQFNRKRIFIYTFQITRPDHPMHLNSAPDDLESQVFCNLIQL